MALLPVLKNLAVNAKCLYDLVNYEYSHEETTLREEMRLKRNAWRAVLPEHPVAAWSDDYIKRCTVGEMRKRLAWCDSVEAYREILPVVVRSFVLLLQDRSFPGVAYKYPVFTEYIELMNAVIGKELLPGKVERDLKRLKEAQQRWGKMSLLLEGMTAFERRKICQELFGEVGRFYLVVREEVGQVHNSQQLVLEFLKQVKFWKEEMNKVSGEVTGLDRDSTISYKEIELLEMDLTQLENYTTELL